MSRKIETHKVNGLNTLNNALDIKVFDNPGAGGASHRYCIYRPQDAVNEELNASISVNLQFQVGNPAESINGISNESLLAVVRDRLEGFQSGPFAGQENQDALDCVKAAMTFLQRRTIERQERGVEGQTVK